MAIAIMGVAMGIIGNMVSLGSRAAKNTKWRSEAQILCDSKMAEVAAGVLPLESVTASPIEENPDWIYSIDVANSDLTGLLLVTVSVEPSPSLQANFEPFILMRMVSDPDYIPEQSLVQ